jgi:hypothetical protein
MSNWKMPALPHEYNAFQTLLKCHFITIIYDHYREVYQVLDNQTGVVIISVKGLDLVYHPYSGVKTALDEKLYDFFEAKELFQGLRGPIVWG